jgi:hypothetical protein
LDRLKVEGLPQAAAGSERLLHSLSGARQVSIRPLRHTAAIPVVTRRRDREAPVDRKRVGKELVAEQLDRTDSKERFEDVEEALGHVVAFKGDGHRPTDSGISVCAARPSPSASTVMRANW